MEWLLWSSSIPIKQQNEQQLHQEGRGRGVGFGRGAGGKQQPPYCHNCGVGGQNCGVGGQHWPHECPNPRSSLRQVRIPRGIPSSYLQETEEGGLLLNNCRTAAVTTGAAGAFAGLPSAKRAALAQKAAQVPALADRPHAP